MTTKIVGGERLLLILTVLANANHELSFKELMKSTGLAQSTLYRLLNYLKNWNFVSQSGEDYLPGPICVPLASGFDARSFIMQGAQSVMNEIRDKSGESVGLLMAVGDRVICLGMAESKHMLRCSLTKGRSVPLKSGASAKALLAFMDPKRKKEALDNLIRNGLIDRNRRSSFESALMIIRKRGYAVSHGEIDQGIWSVSAPLAGGEISGQDLVVTLVAPAARARGREAELRMLIMDGARRISVDAGL